VHPGAGEVLIFLNLARRITDRAVYAPHTFDREPFFSGMEEMTATYIAAIKRTQPEGPYAIVGYSYGGTLAFAMAKVMQSQGDQIPFLAVFDQPSYIKQRTRHSGWDDVLFTLARFFELLPEREIEEHVAAQLRSIISCNDNHDIVKDRLVDILLASASNSHLEEIGLDKKRLRTWTSLVLNSHTIAVDNEPKVHVPLLEVFNAQPIKEVAETKREWIQQKLSRWRDFVGDAQFHEVHGHHYDLIGLDNVETFWNKFSARLKACGV